MVATPGHRPNRRPHMEPPAATPPKPIARLRWLIFASLGIGLAIAAPLIEQVAWAPEAAQTVQWLGHFHPFVLHFPIVLLLVALVFEIARLPVLRRLLPCPDAATVSAILAWGALGCTLAVACGWLLAQSGGYEPELLGRHLWAGAATAFGANLALIFRLSAGRIGAGFLNGLADATLALTCATLTVAGHYGASLTHGETYLTENAPDCVRQLIGLKPRHDANPRAVKPVAQRQLWADVVQPILEERCDSCHHEGKAKGGLRLDTLAALLKGGANGVAIEPGNPQAGLVMKYLQLDPDDAKHMPPKGKPQPTPAQLAALTYWIEVGAPADKTAGDFDLPASLQASLESLLTPAQRQAREATNRAEAAALEAALASLRSKLPGRLACVVPGQPELAYAPGNNAAAVSDGQLSALAPVATSVVALELQQTKVSDAGLAALAGFTKLRTLQLQNTALTDAGLKHLGKLVSLEVLNLYGTGVSDAGLQQLAGLKHLKKVYLWQSKVSTAGADSLRSAIPGLDVNLGLPDTPHPGADPNKETPAAPASPSKP